MATRPPQLVRDWVGSKCMCYGTLKMHAKDDVAEVRILGEFRPSQARDMRAMAKWLQRAADYLEERSYVA